MNIYTYYNSVPLHDQEAEIRLVNLWREHHSQLGLTPVVLQEYHAQKHPHFKEFTAAVDRLPTINPKGYDLACYHRWMAMALVEGLGIMMDYDTYLYPTVGDDMNPLHALSGGELQKLRVYQNTTPCLVVGMKQSFEKWCQVFANYTPPAGCKHTSDMCILEEFAIGLPESFDRFRYVKCYGEPGWDTGLAVHYSNSSMTPNGLTPRWRHIPKLRKLNYEPIH